jgi:hypothetical protein
VDALNVIQHAVYLCLANLDPQIRHAREMTPAPGGTRPVQLFQLRPGAAILRSTPTRRPGCPGCAVGPSAVRPHALFGTAAPRLNGTATRMFSRSFAGRSRASAAGWAFTLRDDPAPPIIHAVEVSAPVVIEGTLVTLSWEATNALRVDVDGFGQHPPQGSITVPVTRTSAFRVRAVNPFGEAAVFSPVVRTVSLPRLREIPVPTLPTISPLHAVPPRPVVGVPGWRPDTTTIFSKPATMTRDGTSRAAIPARGIWARTLRRTAKVSTLRRGLRK